MGDPGDIVGMGGLFAELHGLDNAELQRLEKDIINDSPLDAKSQITELLDEFDDLSIDGEVEKQIVDEIDINTGELNSTIDSDSGSGSDSDSDSDDDDEPYDTIGAQNATMDMANLLEDIHQLKEILDDMKISYSDLPEVDDTMDISQVRNVRDRLKQRYRKHKYWGYMEDILMVGSYGVEHTFNGRREFFGLKPDLSDLSKRTAVKLRRIRYESTNAVESAFGTQDWGLAKTLLFELGPTTVLLAKQNYEKNNSKSDPTSDHTEGIRQGIHRIREYE